MTAKPKLTIATLQTEAQAFGIQESAHHERTIFGVSDGKALGTYFEHKFQAFLKIKYDYERGSSAHGIDFPGLNVDMKFTRYTQPQSSCPFKSARQKIYGLGYNLIVFVYDKTENQGNQTGNLNILHCVYIDSTKTADYQLTNGINQIIENDGNIDDLMSLFGDKMLPVDEIQSKRLAEEVLKTPPTIGYLTISNALQWRLQYRRVINEAGKIEGINKVI